MVVQTPEQGRGVFSRSSASKNVTGDDQKIRTVQPWDAVCLAAFLCDVGKLIFVDPNVSTCPNRGRKVFTIIAAVFSDDAFRMSFFT